MPVHSPPPATTARAERRSSRWVYYMQTHRAPAQVTRLVELIKESDLTQHREIAEVMQYAYVNAPHREGGTFDRYTICRELIADAIGGRAICDAELFSTSSFVKFASFSVCAELFSIVFSPVSLAVPSVLDSSFLSSVVCVGITFLL